MAIVAVGCHAKLVHEQVDSRRVWNKELSLGAYENHVDASTEKDGSTVVVTCALPKIQAGSIRYEVDQIVLRNAEQKGLAALEKKPTFRVALPEQQLKDVVVNAIMKKANKGIDFGESRLGKEVLFDGGFLNKIVLDSTADWTSHEYLLTHVALHEVGHIVLSYNHTYDDKTALMSPSTYWMVLRLNWDEQMGLLGRYDRVRPIPQSLTGAWRP